MTKVTHQEGLYHSWHSRQRHRIEQLSYTQMNQLSLLLGSDYECIIGIKQLSTKRSGVERNLPKAEARVIVLTGQGCHI